MRQGHKNQKTGACALIEGIKAQLRIDKSHLFLFYRHRLR
jgi:hypothetical protein